MKTNKSKRNSAYLRIIADSSNLEPLAKSCGLTPEQFVMVVMKTTIKKKETEDDSSTS